MACLSQERYAARLAGVVSSRFSNRHVLVVGCGAGSDGVLKLARLGLGSLTLVDLDVVEPENLCRTAYTVDDLGCRKVAALAAHVEAANPFVRVRAVHGDVCALGDDAVRELLARVDLIVAGTDFFPAQALLNTWSQRYRIPAVFIGVHARARGGVVIWSIPGETPCYRCVASRRYAEFAREGERAVTLPGEHGSLLDVAMIDAIALKIAAAVLERGEQSEFASFFSFLDGRNQVVVRTHPAYQWGELDLFDLVLADLPTAPKDYRAELQREAFLACDSLWLRTEARPDCPDCRLPGARAGA